MTDHAVPNLPSRDFTQTVDFYGGFGFTETHRDDARLLLRRAGVQLEFFRYADLDPTDSSFMCTLRVDDLDGWYRGILESGVPEKNAGHPRLHPARIESWGGRVAFLVDVDGTQLNLVQNA